MEEKFAEAVKMLQKETQYAVGCTDPIGIALAAAKARSHCPGDLKRMKVSVSPNIFKNAVDVGIPGTNRKGIHIAAAMGIVYGDSEKELSVLHGVEEIDEKEIEDIIDSMEIAVEISENKILLFIEVRLETDQDWVCCRIEDDYNHIVSIQKNGKELVEEPRAQEKKSSFAWEGIDVEDLWFFAEKVQMQKILFLKEGAMKNLEAAHIGIKKETSFGLGCALSHMKESSNEMGSYLKARSYTAGASDARMAGYSVPIMTVAGSGNHGITSLLTILAVWENEDLDDESLLRGLAISALTTILIKWHIQKMNAFCGCAVAAATGAAAGITWMLGGNKEQMIGSMESIMGSLTGMICDGAKGSCSYKVSVASGEAVLHAYLAVKGISIKSPVGILDHNIHQSIKYLGEINDPGMKETDRVILSIIRRIKEDQSAI